MERLFRSRKDRWLGGVCGGIGKSLDIDPTIIRFIWAALWLSGVGFIAYLLAWLIIPMEPTC